MMKYVLCFAFLFCCSRSFSQDSIPKLTAAKVYQDVKDGFQNLVDKLQGPAKHTYEVYVRQHFISGISYAIIATLVFIVCFSLVKYSWSRAVITRDRYDENWNVWANVRLASSIALGLSFMLFCSIFFGNAFREIMNPEYYAIQDILNALK